MTALMDGQLAQNGVATTDRRLGRLLAAKAVIPSRFRGDHGPPMVERLSHRHSCSDRVYR